MKILDLNCFKEKLHDYLENGKPDTFQQKIWQVFNILSKDVNIKDINFTKLDLKAIEAAIEDITYTPSYEEEIDEEDYVKTFFQTYIEMFEIKEALSFLKPLPGGIEIDFV